MYVKLHFISEHTHIISPRHTLVCCSPLCTQSFSLSSHLPNSLSLKHIHTYTHTHTHTHIHTLSLSVYVYVCVCVCVCVRACACLRESESVCVCVCLFEFVNVCVCLFSCSSHLLDWDTLDCCPHQCMFVSQFRKQDRKYA